MSKAWISKVSTTAKQLRNWTPIVGATHVVAQNKPGDNESNWATTWVAPTGRTSLSKPLHLCLTTLGLAYLLNAGACAQPIPSRQAEKLGRGVVAVKQEDGKVFVGWRMLGTDPDNVAFNLYRTTGNKTAQLNAQPLTGATEFVDGSADATQANSYFVRPLVGGKEGLNSGAFKLAANTEAKPYLSIPLQAPAPVKDATGEFPYSANDASVGDLDGDGEYEIILHWAGRGRDNSFDGVTNPPIFQAYKLDGTLLWTINLGKNIREGAHYTQFMVYDLDGDGKAEMVCKTADGTTDSQGKVIGDPNANWVKSNGRILSGPEYLTVFDSAGKAVATTNYIPPRLPDDPANLTPTSDQLKKVWGDGYGNRFDRFLACVAYLDGVHPSVVMARGYYSRTILAAWDFRGGKLTNRWVFDSHTPGNEKFAGQGNHNLSVADVDGDGKDEIIYGKMAVDDDGKGLYSTGIGHGDAIHLSDLDPARPGLEVFSIQESFKDAGAHMFDARSGEILWKKASIKAGEDGEGPGRGLALDIDPRTPGFECWAAGAGLWGQVFDCKGTQIATEGKAPPCNMGIYWDGDLLSELLDNTRVSKWDWNGNKANVILDAKAFGCVSNNGTKANPCLSADILGDWREEVIYHTEDNKELRIFTTTIPTAHRLRTLMSDPVYRLDIAWQNVGYNQPPHLSYYLDPALDGAALTATAVTGAALTAPAPADSKPALYLIGDSTVNNGTRGQMGWGTVIKELFDPAKITVQNKARGGRSSRTFLTEGLWDAVLKNLKPGDFVLMQFGHNDGGRPEGVYPNGRASLKGSGEETREVETKPGQHEVVHTYGWYLRRYIADAKAKGATPIVLSMVPRNDWKQGHVQRISGNYGLWAKEAAEQGGALFVDLNEIVAQHYDALGQETVKGFFPNEHTHTNEAGARLNAQSVVEGLKGLAGNPLGAYLKTEAPQG